MFYFTAEIDLLIICYKATRSQFIVYQFSKQIEGINDNDWKHISNVLNKQST